jgi:hypothetical protein
VRCPECGDPELSQVGDRLHCVLCRYEARERKPVLTDKAGPTDVSARLTLCRELITHAGEMLQDIVEDMAADRTFDDIVESEGEHKDSGSE